MRSKVKEKGGIESSVRARFPMGALRLLVPVGLLLLLLLLSRRRVLSGIGCTLLTSPLALTVPAIAIRGLVVLAEMVLLHVPESTLALTLLVLVRLLLLLVVPAHVGGRTSSTGRRSGTLVLFKRLSRVSR